MRKKLIRLPEELLEQLEETAKKKGFTVNSLIIQILWGYVETKRGMQE